MKNKPDAKKIISIILSLLLSAVLLLLYFNSCKSPARLVLLIAMTFLTFILPKKISFEGFFRSLALLTAILPNVSFHVNLHENPFGFTGFKAFSQVVILYSGVFRILVPAALLLILAWYVKLYSSKGKIEESDTSALKFQRYIPIGTLMLILFTISCVINPLSDLCLFAFDFLAALAICDIAERLVYSDSHNFLANLPYLFLALTAYFRFR
ncbi:MAG: hypothetical protein K5776_12980 [Lachnospiraceae bacterium]|nr:hypothetical protein [Lachnospiraceae bacterium]